MRAVILPLLVASCGTSSALEPTANSKATVSNQRDVILISIDGLLPQTYLDPDARDLEIPNLRKFAAEGAFATAVESVFPSVTYPSHTSIATGRLPAAHGIYTNRTFDPTDRNQGGWYWYSEDIRVPTLWSRAEAAGLTTALINWPVTVGAKADVNVPEYWRAGTPDDVKLSRALTNPPGLLDEVSARSSRFASLFTPPDVRDGASVDIATHVIEKHAPALLMAHLWWVDEMQHQKGLWSQEARASIETVDVEVGRIVEAVREADRYERTVFVIVSDHGFENINKEVSVGVILAKAGLVDVAADGSIQSWKATAAVDGGTALIYAKDDDPSVIAELTALFAAKAADPASGIARVLSRDEIKKRAGDPRAVLAVEAADGFGFTRGFTGDEIIAAKSAAIHGFDPARESMAASLLIFGASIAPRSLGSVRLVDVAPTVAAILGLPAVESDGVDLLRN